MGYLVCLYSGCLRRELIADILKEWSPCIEKMIYRFIVVNTGDPASGKGKVLVFSATMDKELEHVHIARRPGKLYLDSPVYSVCPLKPR